MVRRSKRPCNFPGCGMLTDKSYCEAHEGYRAEKKSSMYNYQWQKESKRFLLAHPFCECDECRKSGAIVLADMVDHRIPHKGNKELFWDRSNWQSMSKKHHSRKTRLHDMGAWEYKK